MTTTTTTATTTPATTTPSVDILNKFAGLGEAVNKVRNDREHCLENIQSSQRAQEELEEQERQMKGSTLKLNNDSIPLWKEKFAAAEKEYLQSVEAKLNQAKWERTQTKQALEAFKSKCAIQRQAFLEESQAFRQECKRMRLEAGLLALDHAVAHSYVSVYGGAEDSFLFDEVNDGMGFESENDYSTMDSDPCLWTTVSPDDDEELNNLQQLYQTEKSKLEAVKEELKRGTERKQIVRDRSIARQERKQQLQTQLDRITKDNEELNEQIQEINRLTEESQQLALSFEKAVQSRVARSTQNQTTPPTNPAVMSVTPLTNLRKKNDALQHWNIGSQQHQAKKIVARSVPHNPYARATSSSSAPKTNITKSSFHDEVSNSAAGLANTNMIPAGRASLLERQQPHRAGGRIRRDRQFGTGLCVTGADEEHAVGGNGTSPLTSANQFTYFIRPAESLDECSEDEDGADMHDCNENDDNCHLNKIACDSETTKQSSFSAESTAATLPPARSGTEATRVFDSLLDLLKDDDDDDDMLGFVAFPHTK